jgi:Membrane-associated sensor, integral membrane domain
VADTLLWYGVAFLAVTMPPLVWVDRLPALAVNGTFTPLFETISIAMSVGAAAAIVLAYRTSRFRSVLDLWLAVACLSMFADVTLQHYSRQFTAGWYASRVSILLAASAVLWVLLFQTANSYA